MTAQYAFLWRAFPMPGKAARNESRSRRRDCARAFAAVVLVALALCWVARAESIWDRRQTNAAFLYSDNVASEKGDILTVLIEDQSSFKVQGERDSEKTTEQTGSIALSTPFVGLSWLPEDTKQSSKRTFQGSHEYNGTRTFADSVTVTVIDELPNGNMVIAGRSEREVAGEVTITVLTGIVKPEDVSGTNAVSSRRVAHLDIYYETTGPTASYLSEGWLNWIINLLWPF
jgi:flagellar L-ring protein precursor FlgH